MVDALAQVSMKDVTSCDKLRWAAHKLWPVDFRMGEPKHGHSCLSPHESIVREKVTRGTETSKYPEEKKSTEIALVAASERASSLNQCMCKSWSVAILVLWGNKSECPSLRRSYQSS